LERIAQPVLASLDRNQLDLGARELLARNGIDVKEAA